MEQDGEGVKHDAGKLRWDLYPWDSAAEVVRVLGFGAEKYADRNWEKGLSYSRVYAAAVRHMVAWFESPRNKVSEDDQESGISHLAHAACCIAFLQAFQLRGIGTDDRPNGD